MRAARRRVRSLAAVLALTLLGACTTVRSPAPSTADPAAPAPSPALRFGYQDIPEVPTRQWAGRFSVSLRSAEPNGPSESGVGRFQLESRGETALRDLSLVLTSPFGQRIAQGRKQLDGQFRLELADGRVLRDRSLDRVIELALGWPVPLERLPGWLDDHFEDIVLRDAQGQISEAVDSGWLIEREPGRWALSRNHPKGQLRVVLVLDR